MDQTTVRSDTSFPPVRPTTTSPIVQTRQTLTRSGLALFVALTIANASNYLFHVIISRLLGPADYGALTALLAGILVLAVPAGAIQVTVARLAAVRRDDPDQLAALVRSSARQLGMAGLAVSAALAAAAPLLTGFLHLRDMSSALVLAAYAAPTLLFAALQGGLQGPMRFGALATVLVTSTLLRIVVGVALVRAGGGVTAAAFASVVGQVAGIALAWWLLGSARARSSVRVRIPLLRDCLWSAGGLTGFWLVLSIDAMLARHYLTPHGSGLYGASVTLSHVVLFAPGAIAMVAFPRFAALASDRRALRDSVIGTTLLVAGIALVAALSIFLVPALAVRILFGTSYTGAEPTVRILSAAMVLLAASTIFLYFHLATRSRAILIFWGAAVLEAIVITGAHGSGVGIAWVVLAVACGVLALELTTLPSRSKVIDLGGQLWNPPIPELDLTVVMPCHNGATSLPRSLQRTQGALLSSGLRFEIVVVSDGSTDGTGDLVRGMGAELRLVDYAERQGKGEALRRGLALARGEYIAFIDADGDLDPAELSNFMKLMKVYEADVVLGSKRHPMSRVQYPLMRRIMSWGYQMMVRALFGLKVRDTQTGMKLFRRDMLARVLPRMLEKRFAFDLELLVVARQLGYSKFFEAPIALDYKFDSTVSPNAAGRILLDTAAIWYRRYILGSYAHSGTKKDNAGSRQGNQP